MKYILILLSLSFLSFPVEKKTRKPNIIIILADDLGYGDLSCYGQKILKTPNLDRMAKEGVRFTDFYSGSTVCAPSRCALMTGLHMGHAYIRGNGEFPMRPEETLMPEIFKQNGYTTGLFGKWGLGLVDNMGSPEKQGWDSFLGYLHHIKAHNSYVSSLWQTQNGLTSEIKIDSTRHSHHSIFEAAVSFIKNNKDRPFLAYLPFTLVHAEMGKTSEESLKPFLKADGTSIFSEMPWVNQSPKPTYKNQTMPKASFASMLNQLDGDVGKIMDLLKNLGIDDNTYVFFTSDNGPHAEGGADPVFFDSNGPLKGIKRDLYEGGIRVPCIAWGGKIKKGITHNEPLANWDFLPTITELSSINFTQKIDGISFNSILKGKKIKKKHDFLYWEFFERGFDQAIRKGNWKAVKQSKKGNKIELYDLSKDIGETTDVAEKNPKIVAEMAALLEKARTESELFVRK
jgi:arylsulfatase A-like enzyme